MTSFAGYDMPVHYQGGIIDEHKHVRSACGIFDVSHMGVIEVRGADADQWVESLTPADICSLQPGAQRYALLMNERGGVVDDLMVSRLQDRLVLVVNAACKNNDFSYIRSAIGDQVEVTMHEELALIAIQGPKAHSVLGQAIPEVGTLSFLRTLSKSSEFGDILISRSGYTGEDGFEVALPAEQAKQFTEHLLSHPDARLAGLGARDTLRLEAGLCLYGHELGPDISPVEADLNWAIGKSRRLDGAREGNFPGADVVYSQWPDNTESVRVGILPEGKAPVRDGAELVDANGNVIGTVSSGSISPTLQRPVAMAFIQRSALRSGTQLFANVRNRHIPVAVTNLPFIPHNYAR